LQWQSTKQAWKQNKSKGQYDNKICRL